MPRPTRAALEALAAAALFGASVPLAKRLAPGAGPLLAIPPGPPAASRSGALPLPGACLAWAVDNNLTARLSLRDPVALVRAKGVLGGACTLTVALLAGERLPDPRTLLPALAL